MPNVNISLTYNKRTENRKFRDYLPKPEVSKQKERPYLPIGNCQRLEKYDKS
jgi:hypothetical protein